MRQKMFKILILEDVMDEVVLIERVLKKEGLLFETRCVDSKEDFIQGIKDFHPNIILSDHALPKFNSMEALKICREAGFEAPFILVTGTVSEEFAVECLRKGADDYILKSNLARLPSAIQNALRKKEYEIFRRKTEKTLLKKNNELLKINKELDSFVYSVSHNLRSPLMSVLGLLHIAKLDDKRGDKIMEIYLKKMESSVLKLDETLKEIIDYSKNSHYEVNYQEIDLHHIFDRSFERFQYLNGFDKVERIVKIHQEAPFLSDNFRMSIIINNLISNAIKYKSNSREKSIIQITATIDDKCLNMDFEDNGIGISEEYIPKIYNMFFRATELSEGSGLGLYIVKESIEKLKGKISVRSQLNEGTSFNIKIPNFFGRTPGKKNKQQFYITDPE